MKVTITLKDENHYELILDNGDSLIINKKVNPKEKLEQNLKLMGAEEIEWKTD